MDELLSKSNLKWRDRAREVARNVVLPKAWHYDRVQEYPWEFRDALRDAELFGVWIPEEFGGHGGGVLDLCLVVEELSRACGGTGVLFAVNALGSFPILLGGTQEQKEKYLPDIAAGKRLIAFGLSERDAGSDAGGIATHARADGDHLVLEGDKKWNTNGGAADIYSIFAITDPTSRSRRISAVIAEKGDEGFEIGRGEDKMGIRCVPVVELHFRNCRVPKDRLLGGRAGAGFKHAMQTLDCARPGVAAQAVGVVHGFGDAQERGVGECFGLLAEHEEANHRDDDDGGDDSDNGGGVEAGAGAASHGGVVIVDCGRIVRPLIPLVAVGADPGAHDPDHNVGAEDEDASVVG